ncbi:MAG: hypothetical protein IPG64_24365 [Haliea sp.]|jgi:hypothetical protein|nr:hypothetical protein [Haliea sp.]MBK6740750.1 hypothetical protein [Haliea sp.]
MTVVNLHNENDSKKVSERLSEARFNSIDIHELVGLCKGVLADGTINLKEAEFIRNWLLERGDVLQLWPADELHALLARVLQDGVLTEAEGDALTDLLEEITGEPIAVVFY